MKEFVQEYLKKAGINIDEKQAAQFEKYGDMLVEWNTVMNLTGITDKKEIVIKHFADSTVPLRFCDFKGKNVIDVGTGAGFPGLPLKIAEPKMKITLMDSLAKRINFLKAVCKETDIDAEYIHGRAEELGQDKDFREAYDIAVSRAVAPLNVLMEYAMPLIRKGGLFVALKGPGVYDEIERSRHACYELGGSMADIRFAELPDTELRHSIVIVEKINRTPDIYPRRTKKIERSPL